MSMIEFAQWEIDLWKGEDMSDEELFRKALILSITAPSDEQSAMALGLANAVSERLDAETIERVKSEIEKDLE
jgi:hypothetical protein